MALIALPNPFKNELGEQYSLILFSNEKLCFVTGRKALETQSFRSEYKVLFDTFSLGKKYYHLTNGAAARRMYNLKIPGNYSDSPRCLAEFAPTGANKVE